MRTFKATSHSNDMHFGGEKEHAKKEQRSCAFATGKCSLREINLEEVDLEESTERITAYFAGIKLGERRRLLEERPHEEVLVGSSISVRQRACFTARLSSLSEYGSPHGLVASRVDLLLQRPSLVALEVM